MILGLATVGVGLWVFTASHALNSACTLSAQSGAGTSCVSGLPFQLLGIALMGTGVVSSIIALVQSIRGIRRRVIHARQSTISTLPRPEIESLREVA